MYLTPSSILCLLLLTWRWRATLIEVQNTELLTYIYCSSSFNVNVFINSGTLLSSQYTSWAIKIEHGILFNCMQVMCNEVVSHTLYVCGYWSEKLWFNVSSFSDVWKLLLIGDGPTSARLHTRAVRTRMKESIYNLKFNGIYWCGSCRESGRIGLLIIERQFEWRSTEIMDGDKSRIIIERSPNPIKVYISVYLSIQNGTEMCHECICPKCNCSVEQIMVRLRRSLLWIVLS